VLIDKTIMIAGSFTQIYEAPDFINGFLVWFLKDPKKELLPIEREMAHMY